MTRITFARIGKQKTVCFAVEELVKYLKAIDVELMVDVRLYDAYDPTVEKVIWVGVDEALASRVPAVRDAYFDDAIHIDVKDSAGVVTGANERSVLIASYRLLKTLGIAWVRPCDDGEVIPHYTLTGIDAYISEAASYRHRAICIEGENGYEHIKQLIDWLPKAGFSGYFFQFKRPFAFFNQWYSHLCNVLYPEEGVSREDIDALVRSLREEIERRKLLLHYVGHGWTADPLGFVGDGWIKDEVEISDDKRELLAMLDGKRGFHKGTPLITELCYSNPRVREIMTDAIVSYCEENPDVDYLHFWLSDGTNNKCTCENCTEHVSDYYMMMLSELDAKMTAKGLHQKVVFLLYCELLWAPLKERFKNEDRFVLMFAPVARHFYEGYADLDPATRYTHETYVKNKIEGAKTLSENIAFLQDWQEIFHGESFLFDYHLCLWKTKDLAYFDMARTIFSDMKSLYRFGLDGMVSCQVNRCAFPHNLCMQLMADALWDKDADFDSCTTRYFRQAFGRDGDAVRDYMCAVSEHMELREELPKEQLVANYKDLLRIVYEFDATLSRNLGEAHLPAVKKSWDYLTYHREILLRYLDVLFAMSDEDAAKKQSAIDGLLDYLRKTECRTHKVLDIWVVMSLLPRNCSYEENMVKDGEVLVTPD